MAGVTVQILGSSLVVIGDVELGLPAAVRFFLQTSGSQIVATRRRACFPSTKRGSTTGHRKVNDGTEGGVRAELAVLVNRHIPVADLSLPGVPYAAPVPVSLPDRATGRWPSTTPRTVSPIPLRVHRTETSTGAWHD